MTQSLKRQIMLKFLHMNVENIKRKVQVVIISEEEVLLFEFNNQNSSNYIGFQNITGAVDEGEDYPTAAKRELFEESGIHGEVHELELTYEFVDRWKKHCFEKIYVCHLPEKPHVTLCEEHLFSKWVSLKKIALEDYTFPSNYSAMKAAVRFIEENLRKK